MANGAVPPHRARWAERERVHGTARAMVSLFRYSQSRSRFTMGNLMHSAARQTRPSSDGASRAGGPQDLESIGRQLLEALPPLRLHSVSVYDDQCNVLWLSEGALGPDEHALVVDALALFAQELVAREREQRVEDGRVAVFLPLSAARGSLSGLVMVLADVKVAGEGLLERILTPAVQAAVQALATVVQPALARRVEHDPTSLVLTIAEDDVHADARATPARSSPSELAPAAVEKILEAGELSLELEPPIIAVAADGPSKPAKPPEPAAQSPALPPAAPVIPSAVTLEILPFVKLRSGGRMRCFEVLPRGTARLNRDPAMLDLLALQRLLAWLGEQRASWASEPTTFTLNLSIATLEDEGFLRQLGAGLGASGISPETVGFEIAEPLCTQRRASVERFIAGCERLGCSVVIDGFSFDSAVVPLLRSKAVRLVKMDPRLTTGALKDKLSQALVVAIVQAVKVLGIHCSAQQIDAPHVLRWLTAAGCDFGQGAILARPLPIERLHAPVSA